MLVAKVASVVTDPFRYVRTHTVHMIGLYLAPIGFFEVARTARGVLVKWSLLVK